MKVETDYSGSSVEEKNNKNKPEQYRGHGSDVLVSVLVQVKDFIWTFRCPCITGTRYSLFLLVPPCCTC